MNDKRIELGEGIEEMVTSHMPNRRNRAAFLFLEKGMTLKCEHCGEDYLTMARDVVTGEPVNISQFYLGNGKSKKTIEDIRFMDCPHCGTACNFARISKRENWRKK